MREIWKDVPGYKGLYKVSNLGNVKSLRRVVVCTKGKYKGSVYTHQEKNMSATPTGRSYKSDNHYLSVMLSKNGKTKRKLVHILVADAFIPNVDKLPQVNHKDGDKTNNRLENLERCTREYNMQHATHVIKTVGCFSPIRVKCVETGETYRSLSEAQRRTGIDRHAIRKACAKGTMVSGKHWTQE